MKNLNALRTWATLLVAFTLAGCLHGCATQDTTTDLSPLQDAYAVRDTVITTKKGLNDARSLNKLTKEAYDKAWATAESADKIVSAQIAAAHGGMVSKAALDSASKKVDEAKGIGGVQ